MTDNKKICLNISKSLFAKFKEHCREVLFSSASAEISRYMSAQIQKNGEQKNV